MAYAALATTEASKVSKTLKPNDLRIIDKKATSGYRHIDKDPELDQVVAAINKSGMSPEAVERATIKIGRKVSAAAIIGWTHGKTRRPQNFTMTSVMLALGYTRGEWTND